MKTFNGWQRLWVVASVIWLATVSVMAWNTRLSEQALYHDWARELLAYLVQQAPELKGHSVESARAVYSDLSDKDLIDALHRRFLPLHPAYEYGFAGIDEKYGSLLPSRTDFPYVPWLRWLVLAVGLPALVYIGGLAFVWVRRGFEKSA